MIFFKDLIFIVFIQLYIFKIRELDLGLGLGLGLERGVSGDDTGG